jgi:signal transduction histidine kinase
MSRATTDKRFSERVLVLAPRGRDAKLCCEVLARTGIDAQVCADMAELVREIEEGAGAAVVVEEALHGGELERLASVLQRQEPWSDFPVIVLGALAVPQRRKRSQLRPLGNVTWLERPSGTEVLVSAVEAALRARRRQYDARATKERDETELRLATEFQQRLIGISGHDLRNPLSVVAMGAALLEDPRIGDALRVKTARRITVAAGRMERIVSDLGDYSRARVGLELPLFPRATDFHVVCDEVLDEVRTMHPEQPVTYEGSGDAVGMWDPDRMKQVLSNLLTNAIKYGSSAHPVELRWHRTDGHLLVEVTNQGAPIPEALLPSIFEPFRLGEQSEHRKTSLGLGLFITRQIVRAHGGDVSVRSSEAEGTTFAFRVPAGSS